MTHIICVISKFQNYTYLYIILFYFVKLHGNVPKITKKLMPKKKTKKAISERFFFFKGFNVGLILQASKTE